MATKKAGERTTSTTRAPRDAEVEDLQRETARDGSTLWEVLTEVSAPRWRTVHRVYASSASEAEDLVAATLPEGVTVLETAPAGSGLGSGDAPA